MTQGLGACKEDQSGLKKKQKKNRYVLRGPSQESFEQPAVCLG